MLVVLYYVLTALRPYSTSKSDFTFLSPMNVRGITPRKAAGARLKARSMTEEVVVGQFLEVNLLAVIFGRVRYAVEC
jgi:hypothetical protein